MMQKIRVKIQREEDDSYDIIIGKDLFPQIAAGLKTLNLDKIAIITDSNVKKFYANTFLDMLKKEGLKAVLISFPAGEKSKTRQTKERIEDALMKYQLTKNSVIIALGGGAVLDLAGFVASTYMRGIPYLSIPTTLLAMVDASIGGKTAVDTPFGKNLIGAFYQPERVFIDISVLKTLSDTEYRNGLAEMIKHAVILDAKFFLHLDGYMHTLLTRDEDVIARFIQWSCKIKKVVVQEDEKELSYRKILNFGHTIGHAIEQVSNYRVSHGQAVALGMIAEAKMAEKKGLLNFMESQKIIDLLKKVKFETRIKKLSIEEILLATHYDKKKSQSEVRYVLLERIGKAKMDCTVRKEIAEKVLGDMT
ncbi:3-dehydroquinate synthase [Candidatus Woesearchaeota archaeon]|nr:3-dehydroquinate synthase [Candidatus Woesearchaeota archaeon]